VTWRTPSSGSSYVAIPNSAFAEAPADNGSAPSNPSGLIANTLSYNKIQLTWVDNSSNETGFEIWRSTQSNSGYAIIGVTPANTTTYSDSLLQASTTYYYQIRSIGQYGESELVSNIPGVQARWAFDGNYNDASGNGKTLSPNGNPPF